GAFLRQEPDKTAEPRGSAFRRRDMDEIGQEREQKRCIDPLEHEAPAKRLKIRFIVLLAVPDSLVPGLDRNTGDTRMAVEREGGRCRKQEEITLDEPLWLPALECDPGLACEHDHEAGRVIGLVTDPPTPTGADRLRNGSARPQQGDDVA